jgi:phytoene synthase
MYALAAEWRALMDPRTEAGVAQIKLAWWQDEIRRLAARNPVHPVSCYLAALPRAAAVDFTPLSAAVDAAAAQVVGAPLEHGVELEAHSNSLLGYPLLIAAQLAGGRSDSVGLRACTCALAAAEYLSRAVAEHRLDARSGRIPFAIDELLAAGIENADLLAADPPERLRRYFEKLRIDALRHFELAAATLPAAERPQHRNLLVLAALGRDSLFNRTSPLPQTRLRDVYTAWSVARRAAAGK